MDPRLIRLIHHYQGRVAEAVGMLESSFGISRPESDVDWAASEIPGRGEVASGERYFKHGIGCAFRFVHGSVDFDFGPKGQFDGFEPHRLWSLATQTPGGFQFSSEKEFFECFTRAVDAAVIVKSDYILYYLADFLE